MNTTETDGITSEIENDVSREEKTQTQEVKTFGKKFKDFMCYNGAFLVIAIIFIVVASILCKNIFKKQKPDINIIILTSGNEMSDHIEKLKTVFEKSTKDINGDGQVVVAFTQIPVVQNSKDMEMALQTRLVSEISAGKNLIYISDSASDYVISSSKMFNDLKLYNPLYSGVNGNKFYFKDTNLAKYLDWKDMPDDMYISIMAKGDGMVISAENYDKQYKKSEDVLGDFMNYITK